jgi:hypothetical protein
VDRVALTWSALVELETVLHTGSRRDLPGGEGGRCGFSSSGPEESGPRRPGTAAKWGLSGQVVMADYDLNRARHSVAGLGERFAAYRVDAGDEGSMVELVEEDRIGAAINAVDPFRDAHLPGRSHCRRHLSRHGHVPVPSAPDRSLPDDGIKLGDEQFAMVDQWAGRGLMALCGIGDEPGLSDVFARYASATRSNGAARSARPLRHEATYRQPT